MSKSHPRLQEPQSLPDVARETLRGWERLRLLFLILFVPSVIAMAKPIEVDGRRPIQTSNDTTMNPIVGGLFANVCHFADSREAVVVDASCVLAKRQALSARGQEQAKNGVQERNLFLRNWVLSPSYS